MFFTIIFAVLPPRVGNAYGSAMSSLVVVTVNNLFRRPVAAA